MPRPAFQQAQIDSVLRAAAKIGSVAHFDAKTLVFTIYPPNFHEARLASNELDRYEEHATKRRGKEHWDED